MASQQPALSLTSKVIPRQTVQITVERIVLLCQVKVRFQVLNLISGRRLFFLGCIECYSNSWGYLPHNSMTDPSPFPINYSNRICSNSRLNHMWHHQLTMSSREWSVFVCNIFQDTDKWTHLTLKFKMFPSLFVTFLALSKYHWLMMWQCSHLWLLILRPWYLYLCTVHVHKYMILQ